MPLSQKAPEIETLSEFFMPPPANLDEHPHSNLFVDLIYIWIRIKEWNKKEGNQNKWKRLEIFPLCPCRTNRPPPCHQKFLYLPSCSPPTSTYKETAKRHQREDAFEMTGEQKKKQLWITMANHEEAKHERFLQTHTLSRRLETLETLETVQRRTERQIL